MDEKKFVILECSGSEGDGSYIPNDFHIKKFLNPFFEKNGWKVVSFAMVNGWATLLGVEGTQSIEELKEAITEFSKSLYDIRDMEENQYPTLVMGGNIEAIFSGKIPVESSINDDVFGAYVYLAIVQAIKENSDVGSLLEESFRRLGASLQKI